MRGSLQFRLAYVLAACACGLGGTPAAAQGSYSQFDESPAAAMARYIRDLASDPKDFDSLIGAGKSALALDDPQAAAGFFARADEVNPQSPLPQAGMGAVSVANGQPLAALPYFKRAQQLGAQVSSFACDRGLAYDLMGQQAQAQADYRLALSGRDADEARRRLALSLAISGQRNAALQTLAPLSAKGDTGVARIRAFVLTLTGDTNAATMAINAVMPGSAANVAPFLQRLPSLSAGQKAAAVNLGIFPDSSGMGYVSAAPTRAALVADATPMASGDRLAGIDALIAPTTPASATTIAQPVPRTAQSVQVAYAQAPAPATIARPATIVQPGVWLQLASGSDADALSAQFRRLKTRNPAVFDGIKPYVARSVDGARLVIGPFRGNSDAEIFAEDLQSIGVSPMKWTNSQADRIAPLPSE